MKAMLVTPLNKTLASLLSRQAPVLVPVPADNLRPVEIKRYVRNLRATRQYRVTDNFIY